MKTKLQNHRIEHEGNVWAVDGYYDPTTKTLKITKVYGDIATQDLHSALRAECDALGMAAEAKAPKA